MSTYKTEGIIIKREYFGEASLALDVYTRKYGKIRAVARSARKSGGKLKGHLELFLNVEIMLARGRNIDTIASSITAENFSRVRSDLKLSSTAYLMVELADKFTAEGHRDEKIFWLLEKALGFLNRLPASNIVETRQRLVSTAMTVLLFQIHLLDLTGFSPELNKCVVCGKAIKPNKNYFSVLKGGIISEECFNENKNGCPISVEVIKLLRLFQLKKNNLNTEEYQNEIDRDFEIIKKLRINNELVSVAVFLMNEFMEFSIGSKIKGIEFFKEMSIMKER